MELEEPYKYPKKYTDLLVKYALRGLEIERLEWEIRTLKSCKKWMLEEIEKKDKQIEGLTTLSW